MSGIRGRKGTLEGLGYLIPPGRVSEAQISRGVRQAMEERRFLAGHGVPSIPTRYVVSLHPADRASLDPRMEDRLARAISAYAERTGSVVLGEISIEFEMDGEAELGRPSFWAGFVDDDLLVLSSPGAAVSAFEKAAARTS